MWQNFQTNPIKNCKIFSKQILKYKISWNKYLIMYSDVSEEGELASEHNERSRYDNRQYRSSDFDRKRRSELNFSQKYLRNLKFLLCFR